MADMVGVVSGSSIHVAPNGGAKSLSITIVVPVGGNTITLASASRGASSALDAPAEVNNLTGRVATVTVSAGAITAVAIT